MFFFIKRKALPDGLQITIVICIILGLASSLSLLGCSSESYPLVDYNNEEVETNAGFQNYDYQKQLSCSNDENKQNEAEKETIESTESIIDTNQYEELIKKPKIGLYTGKGSWPENIRAIKHFLDYYAFPWSNFDENDAVDLNLNEVFDAVWFAGGFSAEYKHFIEDHSKIENFVNQGGLFIGTCAGAYYAVDTLRWQGTDYDYPLKIFHGKGIGPLSGLINWGDKDVLWLEHEHPANFGFKSEKHIYYFDGPYFEPYEEELVTVLARYSVNSQPAIISGARGTGQYLLMGPHPEIGDSLDQASNTPEFKKGAEWPWLYQLIIWVYNNSNEYN